MLNKLYTAILDIFLMYYCLLHPTECTIPNAVSNLIYKTLTIINWYL